MQPASPPCPAIKSRRGFSAGPKGFLGWNMGNDRSLGTPRLQPRSAFSCFALVQRADPVRQQRVGLSRSPSLRRTAGICALETFEATVVVGLSRPYAVSARQPRPGAWRTPYAGLKSPLFQVKDDRSLVLVRSGHTSACGVLCDPISGLLNALISTGFVVANGY
jgi:hypothetical protein